VLGILRFKNVVRREMSEHDTIMGGLEVRNEISLDIYQVTCYCQYRVLTYLEESAQIKSEFPGCLFLSKRDLLYVSLNKFGPSTANGPD
jgi:hypothetical protein